MKAIELMQEKIDATEYWDMDILNFNIKYFGDEISMFIYNDDETSWKLTFLSCLKVQYETDATWRTIPYVKDMNSSQLGYYGQNICLYPCKEDENFINVKMDLSIMQVEFAFKEMLLEKVFNKEISFFWEKN